MNLYAYVGNNAVMFVDRMGLEGKQLQEDINNGNNFYVELVARNLELKLIGPAFIHTFIMIHSYDENLKEKTYTIGGYDEGVLDGKFNDIGDSVVEGYFETGGYKESIFIDPPTNITDKDFVQNIYNEYVKLDNEKKDYSLIGKTFWTDASGNCNNFSTTVLYRASNNDKNILETISDFDPWGIDFGLGTYFKN